MKSITKIVMFLMMITMPVMANDIYVTQSGATLTFDVLQDGQNNTIGNSTTASTVTGATSNFNIDQIGKTNVLLLISMVQVTQVHLVRLVIVTI